MNWWTRAEGKLTHEVSSFKILVSVLLIYPHGLQCTQVGCRVASPANSSIREILPSDEILLYNPAFLLGNP